MARHIYMGARLCLLQRLRARLSSVTLGNSEVKNPFLTNDDVID